MQLNLAFLLFLLCSCGQPRIDEKYAATVVKDKLSLSGNVTAQELKGGSSAKIFLATDGLKKYVVRFIGHKSQTGREEEIYNSKVASDGGYGPHIYFADSSKAIVIMEYLSGKMISDKELIEYLAEKTPPDNDWQTEQFYVALANLLQKIHRGQKFKSSGDYVFSEIRERLQRAKRKYSDYVPLTKIENIVTVIHKALLPHIITSVPCHNDLHRANLMFIEKEFKAFDFESASQGDPFFDVATVAASFFCNPVHEKILFATYLGRQPSAVELAKLYLMKQAVWIKWIFDDLGRLSPESVHQYGTVKVPSLIELAKEVLDGKIDLSKPENKLKLLKARLNQIFESFESQEFKDAVDVLSL